MATEVAHEPAAARKPLDLNTGTDAISGILSREEPEEVVEPQEAPQEAAPEEAAPEETPPEAVEETVEESETDEPTPVEAKDESEDTTSEVELEPAQVAELLGLEEDALEVDDDGTIQIHAKVDGKPAKVPLKDLRRSYELAETHEERLRQLGRERKAFKDESQAALERMAERHQQFTQAVEAIGAEYASDFQSVDWNRLREEDPTEYNAKRLDFEDRKQRISQYQAHARQQSEALQAEHQQKVAEMQTEGAKHLTDVFQGEAYKNAPEWNEDESQTLAKWIMDQGFSAQDIGQVGVWQVFKWARDSMLRESELKAAKETVRKVAKVTKIAKPGKSKPPAEISKSKNKDLKTRQRKSGGGLKETTDLISGLLDRGK
jgi:hypothetical protein